VKALNLDLETLNLNAAPADNEEGEEDGGYYPMLISAE